MELMLQLNMSKLQYLQLNSSVKRLVWLYSTYLIRLHLHGCLVQNMH